MKKFLEEFKTFALRGNMLDLAVGVLIGSAFSSLVTSLTDNIIKPILNCLGTADELSGVGTLTISVGKLNMPIGQFISDVINFIIMAFVIFLIVKGMNKLSSLGKKPEKPAAPTTKKCPYCLSEIPIDAVKCSHCTSDLEVEVEVETEPAKEEPAKAPKKTAKK